MVKSAEVQDIIYIKTREIGDKVTMKSQIIKLGGWTPFVFGKGQCRNEGRV